MPVYGMHLIYGLAALRLAMIRARARDLEVFLPPPWYHLFTTLTYSYHLYLPYLICLYPYLLSLN